MNDYSQLGLTNDIDRSEAARASMTDWWDIAQQKDHAFWLSGTPGEEIWARLGVRERLSSGVSVLNIGVGLGRCTRELAALGCHVSVLDISPRAIERVSDVAAGWIRPEDLPAERFNLALSHLVMQHMPDFDVQDQIAHVIRSLTPDGLFAFQYTAGADGQCTPQYRNYAKSGAIRRRPADIENVVSQCGGRLVGHFQRETHACGTQWWVAHVVRADSPSEA
jgi:SAM-dependent methyltransferase